MQEQYRGFTFKHIVIDVADVDGDVIDDDDCRKKQCIDNTVGDEMMISRTRIIMILILYMISIAMDIILCL